MSPLFCHLQVTKHSAHAGRCPTSCHLLFRALCCARPSCFWANPPSARSPPPLASPMCPHLFYFSPQPSPPCAVYTSTLLSIVPRRCPQVFASSSSSPVPIHLSSLLGMSSLSCSPHCLSGPLRGGHPSCLVPQSRPAAIRLLLPKASPVSTISKAQ